MNPPKAERAKPSLSSDYNLLFKNKIGERSLDIHRSNTPFKLSGSQNISVSDTVFTGLGAGQNSRFGIYAHNGYGFDVKDEKETKVELNNVTFKDNTVSYASLFVYDKTTLHMKGGAFLKNKTTDIGGGAMIKSGTIIFEDVLFQDNVAKNESKKTILRAYVWVVSPPILGNESLLTNTERAPGNRVAKYRARPQAARRYAA